MFHLRGGLRRGAPWAARLVVRTLLAALLGVAAPLGAQTEVGTIAGVVRDGESGAPLPDAVVLVQGTLLRALTNRLGIYHLAGLAPGRYIVRAALVGYERGEHNDVEVDSAHQLTVDFSLSRAPVELAPVTVTASRTERGSGDTPASEAVLSDQEIVRRNVVTIDQALPYVSGVTFNNGDMDIRGASGIAGGVGSRVLIMLDDQPLLSADGGEVDFKSIPLLDIDRVEVVKGAYSALYGSNALGGVVNILTTPIAEQPQSAVNVHWGAYELPKQYQFADHAPDLAGVDLQHSRRLGDVGARLFVARENTDGWRQDDFNDRWLLRSKVALNASSSHPSTLYALFSSQTAGNFFTWYPDTPDLSFALDPNHRNDKEHDKLLNLGATLVPMAGSSSILQVQPYLLYNSTQNDFYNDADSTGHGGDTDRDRSYHRALKLGANSHLTLTPSARHTVTLGAEAAFTQITSDFLGKLPADPSDFVGRPSLRDGGIYAQDDFVIGPTLGGSVGLRGDYHQATGGDAETSLNPKLGLVYRPTQRLSTRISIARGYRAASAIEQFVSARRGPYTVIPNPSLRGESAWSAEAGATTRPTGRLWLDGAIFQSEYRGLISPAAEPGSLEFFQFRNVGKARIRGLDVSAKTSLIRDVVSVQVNYLLLDSHNLDTAGNSLNYGKPLPYRSRHNLTTTFDVLQGLFGVDVRYRSRVEQVLAYETDPRKGFTIVDVRAGARIRSTTLQARVSNLFQEQYVDIMERTPGAPRNVLLTALWNF